MLNDLTQAETWGMPPWEVAGKDPRIWREPYRLLHSIFAEVQEELKPTQ